MVYGITIPPPPEEDDSNRAPFADELLSAYGRKSLVCITMETNNTILGNFGSAAVQFQFELL